MADRRSREDPSAHASPRDGELHLKALGVHVCGFETSPYGVEWMRFDTHCEVPEIVKTVPHLAFAVDNLDIALQRKADPHSAELAVTRGASRVHRG